MKQSHDYYPEPLLEMIRSLFVEEEFVAWLQSIIEPDPERDGAPSQAGLPELPEHIGEGFVLSAGFAKWILQVLYSPEVTESGLAGLPEKIANRRRANGEQHFAEMLEMIQPDWPPIVFSRGGEPFAAAPQDSKYKFYNSIQKNRDFLADAYFELAMSHLRLLTKLGIPAESLPNSQEALLQASDRALHGLSISGIERRKSHCQPRTRLDDRQRPRRSSPNDRAR